METKNDTETEAETETETETDEVAFFEYVDFFSIQ